MYPLWWQLSKNLCFLFRKTPAWCGHRAKTDFCGCALKHFHLFLLSSFIISFSFSYLLFNFGLHFLSHPLLHMSLYFYSLSPPFLSIPPQCRAGSFWLSLITKKSRSPLLTCESQSFLPQVWNTLWNKNSEFWYAKFQQLFVAATSLQYCLPYALMNI